MSLHFNFLANIQQFSKHTRTHKKKNFERFERNRLAGAQKSESTVTVRSGKKELQKRSKSIWKDISGEKPTTKSIYISVFELHSRVRVRAPSAHAQHIPSVVYHLLENSYRFIYICAYERQQAWNGKYFDTKMTEQQHTSNELDWMCLTPPVITHSAHLKFSIFILSIFNSLQLSLLSSSIPLADSSFYRKLISTIFQS